MTKKDYIVIARVIRESDMDIAPLDNPHGFELDKILLMSKLAHYFKEDNDLFDEDKFNEACLIPHRR